MSTEDRNSRDFDEARIKQEASDWVAKHDRGLSAEEQDAFFEWLAESPAHSEAYSRRQIVWKEMNVLADWRPEHSEEPNPDLLAVSPAKSKIAWYWAVAGIAALLVVGLFIGSNLRQSNQSDRILLASGERRFYEHHVLEDGSKVELNRGAQALVRFTEDKRLIDLLAGEAHFTVAKDKNRPFVVRARGCRPSDRHGIQCGPGCGSGRSDRHRRTRVVESFDRDDARKPHRRSGAAGKRDSAQASVRLSI